MREIKFRAFDKIKKQICDVVTISFKTWDSDDSIINYIVLNLDGHEERLEHEVYIMQYTGLKDKNGKEIYEGDIVRHPTAMFLTFPMKNVQGTIKYEEKEFYIDCPGYEYDFELMEIIGNIHENYELLENK